MVRPKEGQQSSKFNGLGCLTGCFRHTDLHSVSAQSLNLPGLSPKEKAAPTGIGSGFDILCTSQYSAAAGGSQ